VYTVTLGRHTLITRLTPRGSSNPNDANCAAWMLCLGAEQIRIPLRRIFEDNGSEAARIN